MRSTATIVALLLVSLSTVYSAHAYVYYVEAENFDSDSVLVVEDRIWTIEEDAGMSNGKYMQYSGPHVAAETSLFYTLSEIDDSPEQCKIWLRCLMPDGGANSYFFYVSTDGGGSWGDQQVTSAAEAADWKWESWDPATPFEMGPGNVLRVSEREDAYIDLICIRNDGITPSTDEHAAWLEITAPVEPIHKITTTWGNIRSAY